MSYQTGALDMTLLNGEQVDQVKDDPEFTSVGAGYLWYISPNIGSVRSWPTRTCARPSPLHWIVMPLPETC